MVRTCVTILVVCLYAACVHLYIHELTHTHWAYDTKKVFYNTFNLAVLVFYLFDKRNFKGWFHKKFNEIIIILIACNNALWAINWMGWLGDAENPIAERLFTCFYGAVFITTLMFLIAGIRHKTFRYI